jgi:uncharacterized membrane protein YkoI
MKQMVLVLMLFAWFSAAPAAPSADASKLKDFPPEVCTNMLRELGEAKIAKAAKTLDEDRQANYEVTIDKDGITRDFTFDADGKLLEKEVFLEELPARIQKTIGTTSGDNNLASIHQTTDEKGKTNYDVEVARAGVTRDFTVAANGTLTSIQVFLNETPSVVQKTILETVGGGTLGDITKSVEDGEISYDVEMTKDGRKRGFSVGTDGELESIQVFVQETPEGVQKTIHDQLKDGKIKEINKETDDEKSVFVVTMTQDGKTRDLTITPDGRIVPAAH